MPQLIKVVSKKGGNEHRIIKESEIYEWAKDKGSNVVTRNLQKSCCELLEFEQNTPLNEVSFRCSRNERIQCYGCGKFFRLTHPVYVFSCVKCGAKYAKYRHLTRDLTGQVAVVIGGRSKLGHQIVLKLLMAGATVILTTRYPERADEVFRPYKEWGLYWKSRLKIYPSSFDLDTSDISASVRNFAEWISKGHDSVDILVNCAAQTIKCREKNVGRNGKGCFETNRYGDAKFLASDLVNSWHMTLLDLVQDEMEQVYRINALAPTLLIQGLLPLLQASPYQPYIINVHAREGLFNLSKSNIHVHTNMAKAGLAMLTKCLKRDPAARTHSGIKFSIHGCDPGWLSIDEYYEKNRPWTVPPLDEIDGAARILYPLFRDLKGSYAKTRRHFTNLTY